MVLALETGIRGYNWWMYQQSSYFDTKGWTTTCDNGEAREQWTGRPNTCGTTQTVGNHYNAVYWNKVRVTTFAWGRTYMVGWWRDLGSGLTPWKKSAQFDLSRTWAQGAPTAATVDADPTFHPQFRPAYGYGGDRPMWVPGPQAMPIGNYSPAGYYPVPWGPMRNNWGQSIGLAPVNVGGVNAGGIVRPRPGTAAPPIIVVPVPIPGVKPSNPPIVTYPPVPIPPTTMPGTIPVVTIPPIVTPYPVDPVTVVPRAPTYVQAGTSGVALAHTAHAYSAPPRGTKEAKIKGVPRAAQVVLGTITESLDVLDCLHKALPRSRQIHRKKVPVAGKAVYAANRGAYRANQATPPGLVRGFKWERAAPVDKFHAVKTNLQHVDLPAAVLCMYQEQILDIAYAQIGKIGGKAAAAARLHGNLPIGFQTGYAH